MMLSNGARISVGAKVSTAASRSASRLSLAVAAWALLNKAVFARARQTYPESSPTGLLLLGAVLGPAVEHPASSTATVRMPAAFTPCTVGR